ncbi:MAG TPA: YqaA family protein [Patescibacteria group bacterium]
MTTALRLITAPSRAIRKLYNWTIHWSKTKHASRALFVIAFAEASFFPIPPDVLLIPMVISDRARWWRTALICTVGSVLGAMLGYAIGMGLYKSVGQPIVDAYGLQSTVNLVGQKYADNAFLTVLTAAFTPIPYKVITIAAGLFKISFPTLVFASVVGRAGRFFIVAGLLRVFGEKIEEKIEKYFDLFALLFFALLVGGFFAVRYLH